MNPVIPDISLSHHLKDEVAAVVDAGLYDSEEKFLADAVRTLLAARPDLREAIACKPYERDIFSLGKAAEWASISIEEMKESLYRHGIDRTAPESVAETEAMAQAALRAAGRAKS